MEYRTYEICGELRHYSTGDMIHTRGQAWVLDQDEYDPDVWWARNKDGEEIEFIPGKRGKTHRNFLIFLNAWYL